MKVFAQTSKYADPAGYAMKSQDEPAQSFAQGQVAANFNWDFEDTTNISNPEKSKIVGKSGLAIMPGIGANRSGSSNGWEGYGINVNSDNKDLAAAWVEFTLREDNQLAFYKTLGFQSSRRSLLSDPDFQGKRGTPILAEQFNHPVQRFGFGASAAVNEIFDVVLHKVKDGTQTPEDAIAELATKVQATVDEWNSTH
jgi:ABC-type glycerol-3-phosphate transport system substrate-binding protein